MAENSRIEDLRKRYHENPRRFFAPLANEYRKAGFLDRALLLCQKHVPEQPDNMNGLVVFGQTLFESGKTADAQQPFERALALDPENLIALRHLGDIARIAGDVPTAKQWYDKVLELDRRNDEVLDLLQQMGVADVPEESPAPRPSATAGGLVSVAASVSMSSGGDLGMIDLDSPSPAPAAAPKVTGPVKTVVINAQALADRDRRDADDPATATLSVDAGAATLSLDAAGPVPAARPSRRASLLDIDFDFSETGAPAEAAAAPAAQAMGAEGAEYGIAVETTGDVAPLAIEPTIAEAEPAPAPALPAGDFELAEFSTEVAPLAGLEATEFTSEDVAPLADLDNDTASASISAVAPLDGLDRPDVNASEIGSFSAIADLPLLGEEESASVPLLEEPSARPKPRMTKADMSSLPLLADFGLEDDDEPASSKPTPIITPAVHAEEMPSLELPSVEPASARLSKATPAFVTETMAALYVKQGHIGEAVGVYRQLVAQAPNDTGLRAKLTELERMQREEELPVAAAEPEMPEFDAPIDSTEPEPAAANAAMADLSFGDLGLQGQGSSTQLETPSVPAGPSAREFFGGFARRAAVAAAVVAASVVADTRDANAEPDTATSSRASSWPLDALFGAAQDVRDLHAAEVLAGVGTFEGPNGGTGMDALFAEPTPPARRSVPRASEMLKFDQFFQAPGTATPAAPAAPDGEGPGGDDLDQFHGWLQGLKK